MNSVIVGKQSHEKGPQDFEIIAFNPNTVKSGEELLCYEHSECTQQELPELPTSD